jgi:beta-galactosidase
MKRQTLVRAFALTCLGLTLGLAAESAADDGIFTIGTRAVKSLNGLWDVRPIKGLNFSYPPPADGWSQEQVPSQDGHTATIKSIPYMMVHGNDPLKTGKFAKEDGMATWFRHRFRLPANLPVGKRVVLHFGGMAYRSETWLNGRKLGTSYQCTLPLDYDVTDAVKPGQNELLVGLTGLQGIMDLKNKTMLTPAYGAYAGIRDSVELRFVPELHVDDIFVKTSVTNQKLEAVVGVVNSSGKARTIAASLTVSDPDGVPVCSVQAADVVSQPGQNQEIVLAKSWLAKRLWSPSDPAIYTAKVELKSGGQVLDARDQTFGYKEFEIRGRDFYLNGVRTVLFRNSTLTSLGTEAAAPNVFAQVRNAVDNPYNCIRLHLGFNNRHMLDTADRVGMMTIPEASWNHINKFPSAKKDLWLPNTLAYYRGWIKENRNRPSVIMWSLCNETYWDHRDPAELPIAKQILQVAQEMDPTRPQQGDGEVSWNGMLPTTNIHYPEGTAGTVRLEYPNSGLVVPNDLHWLKTEGVNQSWRAEFVWDRPLMLGEYWHHGGDILATSSYMGDSAFDWEKWRFQKVADPSYSPENAYIATLQKATDWYRKMGVACLNPWSGERKLFLKAVDVRPLDFHPNFQGGQTGTRKVIVFNDSFQDYYNLHLQCDLKMDDTTVWQDEIKTHTPKGTHREADVTIAFPVVTRPTEAKLTVRLRYWRSGGWRELARFDEDVFVMPKVDFQDVKTDGVVLYDPSGATAAKLKTAGLALIAQKTLTPALLQDTRLLIVGTESNPRHYAKLLETFARDGGRILVLRQKNWQPFCSELPESDPKHAASQAWVRSFGHPLLTGTFEKQFSYWRPEHLIATQTFWKPSTGNVDIVLDCGGRFGMMWSPLLTVALGQGETILSQLNLIDSLEQEPMAPYLLRNLIRYGLRIEKKTFQPLRLLAGSNDILRDVLKTQGVVIEEDLAGAGPILLDSSAALSKETLATLAKHVQDGGTLWLHGFTPESLTKIESLMPFKPELVAPDQTVKAATRRSQSPLINGLASFDFLWTSVDAGGRADYFQRSKPTAKLGDFILKTPAPEQAHPLLAPAFFVEIPTGKGSILFDTLQWEKAIAYESDKAGRVVSSLVTNVGGKIELNPEKKYEYFHVDLKSFANMGYYDQVANDGKGGWTDQGQNDMRFFLTNHTGRGGGTEDGMPIATEPFPAKARLAKRPFALVAPDKNNGKAVIALRGGEHGPSLLDGVDGMLVGKKADMLWFLQTGCWVQITKQNTEPVAKYLIHYQDGSSVTFPIRAGAEIGDWWSPTPLPKSIVAWTGRNLKHSPIGVWMTPWENPFPEKIIESIDLKGNLGPSQLVLLAITGGVETSDDGSELLSKWDLSEFRSGMVANAIPGMPSLKSTELPPTPSEDKALPGLRFMHGQSMWGDTRKIPGFLDGTPFKLSVLLTPQEKPDGYFGGIFQSMRYHQAGFRVVLQKSNMKLNVQIFTGPKQVKSLNSKAPLTLGHDYRLDLVFKNGKAYLYLNNKLDDCIDSPPPAACPEPFRIGTASGKDYNYNGIIKEIAISKLEN